MNTEIMSLKKILLVEDDPRDVELTLAALAEHNLANQVAVVRDGAEALDYLYRRGKFKNRAVGHPSFRKATNHETLHPARPMQQRARLAQPCRSHSNSLAWFCRRGIRRGNLT